MQIYRPKKGPVLTHGRLQHFLFGLVIVFGTGIGGYVAGAPSLMHIAQWGLVFVFFFGLLWEGLTPIISRFTKWTHPFADSWDFFAYFAGGIVAAMCISLGGC